MKVLEGLGRWLKIILLLNFEFAVKALDRAENDVTHHQAKVVAEQERRDA